MQLRYSLSGYNEGVGKLIFPRNKQYYGKNTPIEPLEILTNVILRLNFRSHSLLKSPGVNERTVLVGLASAVRAAYLSSIHA